MVNYRVNKTKFWVIIFFSVSVDILSIILTITGAGAVVDIFVTVIAYAIIIIYFRVNNVKVFSIKTIRRIIESKNSKSGRGRTFKKILSMIGEFIPFVDLIVPGYTLFAYYTYKDACEEDEALAKKGQIEGGSYVNKIRNNRRGSVEGSGGNRMENRRDKRVNQTADIMEGESNNVLPFRQKRAEVKYNHGAPQEGQGLKKASGM